MHKGFIDKNRRLFNLRQMQVDGVLPEHFAQYYPKLITLLEKYYDWQGARESVELIQHLFASRDVNEVDIALLSFIEDELLLGDAYIEGFGDTDAEIRAAANFSNILFRSKGSKFAIEWFFRSFYGIDVEVFYPKENIFTLNNSTSTIGPDSLRYLTNDKLYQTFALLVKTSRPISEWNDIFKLFAHPAGMYLGGQVLVTDTTDVVVATDVEDSVVSTSSSKSYTLTASPGLGQFEGNSFTYTADGTNVPEGIDALYYYIKHLTTSDSDFVGTVPDSNNPAYFSINSSTGSFDVFTKLDSAGSEGTEQYSVYIKDQYGNVYDSATSSILNVGPTYSISTVADEFFEGDTITVTVTGLNAPAKNSTVYWYATTTGGATVTADDFDPTIPLDKNNAVAVNVVDGTATFTIGLAFNSSSESATEDFVVVLTDAVGSSTQLDTKTLTINDVTRTVTVTVNDIVEGAPVVANITVNNSSLIGESFSWSMTGADSRFTFTTGTVTIESLSQNYTITTTAVDNTYNGGSSSVTLDVTGPTSIQDNDVFNITDAASTYLITPSPTSAAEGDTVTFNISGTNIPDGTYYFAITHGTTTDADFSVAPPTSTRQAVTIASNASSPSPTLTFSSNGDVSNETFTAQLYTAATGGTAVATVPYTITGSGVSYSLSPSSPQSYDEGNTIDFAFTGTGFADGTYYYWVEATSGSSITSSDFVSGANFTGGNRQSFSVAAQNGPFSITLANDQLLESSETFIVNISDSISGGALATSAVITINDTSTQSYTIVASDVTEGGVFGATVTPNFTVTNDNLEDLYFVVTGSGVTSRFNSTQATKSFTSPWSSYSQGFFTSATDAYEGPQTGTISLYRGSYGGTLLASDTFTMSDQAATYTLTADDTTPNEGSVITFNVAGTNIPSGTYYYTISSDIITSQTDATASSGQSFIPLASTTGIVVGMESNVAGVNGTVTNVSTGAGVTMSQNLTSTLSSGTAVHFALPAVFDDFDTSPTGSFTISSNSGQFAVDTALNGDFTNDSYTFAIKSVQYGGSNLATESITIQDQSSGAVSLSLTQDFLSDFESSTSPFTIAQAAIKFRSDGTIQALGNVSPGSEVYTANGTWITGTFNASDYKINAVQTIAANGPEYASGSYSTDLILSSDREWALNVVNPNTLGTNSGTMTVQFTVTQISNPSNTANISVEFYVSSQKLYEVDGGFEP